MLCRGLPLHPPAGARKCLMLPESERRRIRARQHAAGDAGGGSTDDGTDDEDGGVSRGSTPNVREWTVGRNRRQFWAGASTPPTSPTALGVGWPGEAALPLEAEEAEGPPEEEEAERVDARLARAPALPPNPQLGCVASFDGFELRLESPSDGLPGRDLGGPSAPGDGVEDLHADSARVDSPCSDSPCEAELQRERREPAAAAAAARGGGARREPRLGSPLRAATISNPAPPPTPIGRATSASERGSPSSCDGRARTAVDAPGLGQPAGSPHGACAGEAEAEADSEAAEAEEEAEAEVGVVDDNQTELAPVGEADCAPAETELDAVGDTEGVGVRDDTEPVGEQAVGARGGTELAGEQTTLTLTLTLALTLTLTLTLTLALTLTLTRRADGAVRRARGRACQ